MYSCRNPICFHQSASELFAYFSLLPFDLLPLSFHFLPLLPFSSSKRKKKKKTNEQTQQNRNRVIDTENKQVVARREVGGRRKELSEGD